eukprot:12333787-Alexandrium_andersonii.AAC.1
MGPRADQDRPPCAWARSGASAAWGRKARPQLGRPSKKNCPPTPARRVRTTHARRGLRVRPCPLGV